MATGTVLDPTGPTALRFPLIARTRPPCRPLPDRVAALGDLAAAAVRDQDPGAASAVHNQAALLASDLGMPDLARRWCHQHALLYLRAAPLTAKAARHALEPLVNLARLHLRDGNGATAFHLLDTLYQAVSTRTDTLIDGIPLPAADLTRTDDEHLELLQWLWAVHLSDGARALSSAGRWQDAHAHLDRHHGIGQRLLDGRQVAVIARCTSPDTAAALTLLDASTIEEPWEHAVAACLRVLCQHVAGDVTPTALAQMLATYQQLPLLPHLAVFHTRLGLSIIDAIPEPKDAVLSRLAAELIQRTIEAGDGYAARDLLLTHLAPALTPTTEQTRQLHIVLDACGLGHGTLPTALKPTLNAALRASSSVITAALAHHGARVT